MKIPLNSDISAEIEIKLAKFSRGWTQLDPMRRSTAFKVLVLCEMLGGRQQAAKAADVADNTIDNYRHGKKDPTFVKLQQMAEMAGVAARYLTGDWLFERDGIRIDMAVPSVRIAATVAAMPPGLMDNPPQPYVHGYDIAAPAGDMVQLMEGFWERLGLDPAAVTTLLAEGDGMMPTIADRTPVFVDTADRDLVDGGIYAIRLEGRVVMRRVQRLVGGGVQLIADNGHAYPRQEVGDDALSRIEVVGRVRSAAVAL
jgi:transcriptional regulator with XRE-family HTH domain